MRGRRIYYTLALDDSVSAFGLFTTLQGFEIVNVSFVYRLLARIPRLSAIRTRSASESARILRITCPR